MVRFQNKFLLLTLFVLGCILFAYLEYQGIIWHTAIFTRQYSIRGLDVSNHQGTIDWKKVADTKKYTFVYIKATEGSDYTDDYFVTNWEQAKKNNLLVGAYHFFSSRSSGKEQAEFFISQVPKENDALPSVVDVEIGLEKDPDTVRKELTNLLTDLEQYYQKRPILYVRYDTYKTYIEGHFLEHPLWVRDIFKYPTYNRSWVMWQYTNRGRADGIQSFVDINVFTGTKEELIHLTK